MKPLYFLVVVIAMMSSVSFFAGCANAGASSQEAPVKKDVYQCMPCGNHCDAATYGSAGECPQCRMPLVKKSSVTFQTIEASAVCDYVAAHPGVVLLDVRTKEEFEGKASPDFGTLKAAVNIPVQELESKLPTINHLKNKEIIVYCSHSHRSPRASYILTQNGFTNVTNMAGGMSVLKDGPCRK